MAKKETIQLLPAQQRLFNRLQQENLLLYHAVDGRAFYLAVRENGRIVKQERINRMPAEALVYLKLVQVVDTGTWYGHPYRLYARPKRPEQEEGSAGA